MIDVEMLLKKTKPEIVKTLMDEISELDLRRQQQIQNQVGTINRLMAGATPEEEILTLHEKLAEAETRLQASLAELRVLRGETTSAYNLGLSKEV